MTSKQHRSKYLSRKNRGFEARKAARAGLIRRDCVRRFHSGPNNDGHNMGDIPHGFDQKDPVCRSVDAKTRARLGHPY